MKYEIIYSPVDNDESVSLMFETFEDLSIWVLSKYDEFTKYDIVFLFACEGLQHNEILVSEDIGAIVEQMEVLSQYADQYLYFLQEYESYEDAYMVALTMKETSDLCYNKK